MKSNLVNLAVVALGIGFLAFGLSGYSVSGRGGAGWSDGDRVAIMLGATLTALGVLWRRWPINQN